MDYHDSIDLLKSEVARLKTLLSQEQAIHREFRAEVFMDVEFAPIIERRQRGEQQQRTEDYTGKLLGEIEELEIVVDCGQF